MTKLKTPPDICLASSCWSYRHDTRSAFYSFHLCSHVFCILLSLYRQLRLISRKSFSVTNWEFCKSIGIKHFFKIQTLPIPHFIAHIKCNNIINTFVISTSWKWLLLALFHYLTVIYQTYIRQKFLWKILYIHMGTIFRITVLLAQ